MNDKDYTSSTNASSTQASSGSSSNRDLAAIALRSTVADGAKEVTSEAKHLANDVAREARRTARNQIAEGKDRAAEGLGTVAMALRKTSENLADEDEIGVTHYISKAADQVDSLSLYLRDRSFGEVVRDVERFARREPALFLGGAFVAGLIGGRFLKSTRPRRQLSSHTEIQDDDFVASSPSPSYASGRDQEREGARSERRDTQPRDQSREMRDQSRDQSREMRDSFRDDERSRSRAQAAPVASTYPTMTGTPAAPSSPSSSAAPIAPITPMAPIATSGTNPANRPASVRPPPIGSSSARDQSAAKSDATSSGSQSTKKSPGSL